MLSWSITLFLVALISGILGFSGISGAMAGFTKFICAVFTILFVTSLFFYRKSV